MRMVCPAALCPKKAKRREPGSHRFVRHRGQGVFSGGRL
jgi:hypothetical protein